MTDVTMDNQQVDLAWLAGLYDGEGCIWLGWIQRDSNYRYLIPHVHLTNTSVHTMNAAATVLRRHGVPFNVTVHKQRKSQRPLIHIQTNGLKRAKRFLSTIGPYLVGKKAEADLLSEYIESRLRTPHKAPYSDREQAIVKQLAQYKRQVHFRDSEPNGGFLGTLEDIVQVTVKAVA